MTVTSSDDELQMNGLSSRYKFRIIQENITQCSNRKHHFYILNRGQAVNFVHGAAVGPFIYLVQAEILVSIGKLCNNGYSNDIHELDDESRVFIAETWFKYFGSNTTPV